MQIQNEYYEEQSIKNKKFQNTIIENCTFADCNFENCTFESCQIKNCFFVNCKFQNCNIISLTSKHSEIKNAAFKKCNLIGVHWNELLPTGKYAHCIDCLKDCYLKYNTFAEMSFIKFDFSTNIIQECMFEECNLQESSFKDCRLEATEIYRCDIRKADFRGAMGYVIDISSNKLKQAKFSFPEVVNLLNTLEIKID